MWSLLQETPIRRKIVNIRKLDEVISSINGCTRDIGRFLKQFRDRVDKIGNNLLTVEVRFQDLTIKADCYIGNTTLPSLPNAVRNSVESLLGSNGINFSIKTRLAILKDASGLIKPSRMSLLLGPSSSGMTTLLLALAGKLNPNLKNDVHVGEMLKELAQRVLHEILKELAQREKQAKIFPKAEVDFFMKATAVEGDVSSLITYYTLKILGLDICRDTIVGDAMQRGISGGQKKKVYAIERTSSMSELNDNDHVGEMLEISEAIRDYHNSTRFPNGLRVKSEGS
ncbi:ABC transporter G family member 35-like protein isoform X5 [Tanacetum coccineum]